MALHHSGDLAFFGDLAGLAEADAFAAWLAPLRKSEWVVYAKPPFGGLEAVLAYLSRCTHRVALSNNRLISADAETVTFRWKDCRIKTGDRQKVMRLATDEFIRRFLIHVLPDGFTASAITACWPAQTARPMSPRSGHCSGRRRHRRMTRQAPRASRSP
ncbi:Mobile element protein (plasmid) [Sinorhizobium sojae CCBAU 05684]|uniref:Mobile element protein n=1 Tax=Sinorhizobium sojae CCBAU 05684 TaxID=716928 RepID=A0A249PJV6_9HYPH|nr:Mobile element protein [Sinorhizobium sojae CCBAU 05684]